MNQIFKEVLFLYILGQKIYIEKTINIEKSAFNILHGTFVLDVNDFSDREEKFVIRKKQEQNHQQLRTKC